MSNKLLSQTYSSPIIADHTISKLSVLKSIPAEYIAAAKNDLHIAYEHTSHGEQLVQGMTGLVSSPIGGNTYAFNTGGSGGALDLRDHAIASYFSCWGMDLGNTRCPSNEQYYLWATNTRTYLETNPGVNVVIWSWCGQLSYATDANVDQYLTLMNQLEIDYPDITFIYMTGHVDQWQKAPTGRVYLNNKRIRDYCIANNKVLFDFADIESYDPDNNYYADKYTGDDGCWDGNGNGTTETNGGDPALPINGDRNWMLEWQDSHTLNVDWYQCSASHSYPLNSNLKAYAAWWLWARLAGWSGTNAIIPTVTSTTAASSITQNTAISGGTISSDGGSPVTARGVCWDQAGWPALDNVHTVDGDGTGTFTSNITGLNANTKYYVKAYATNSAGTAYGPRIEFTTASTTVVPTVTTTAISTITATGAVAGGNVVNDGGATVTERGVCWSTSSNPTTSNSKQASGSGTGSFTVGITGLNPETTYHVRAYAINSQGTSYGSDVSFTTFSNVYNGPNYYIDVNGVDTDSRNGSVTQPWKSLYYACTKVLTFGNTINVNAGDYYESHLCPLSPGVNLKGVGNSSHIIFSNFADYYASIYLYSPQGVPVNGNQSISYLWLDGNNLAARRAINVMYRENVSVHHCKINNFYEFGIGFDSNDHDYLTAPSYYTKGISVYECDFDNNSTRATGNSGHIRLEATELAEIYNCTFDQTTRPKGQNGNIITTNWNIAPKIHDCEFVKNDDDGGEWNFFFEVWHFIGGGEIYKNKFIGGAILDVVNVTYGTSSYGLKIYENEFTMSSQYNGIYVPPSYHTMMAIDFEDRGSYEGIHIYKNKINNFPNGIWFVCTGGITKNAVIRDINVHDNVLTNIGYTNYAYSYGIFFNSERSTSYTVTYDNINIYNNVVHSNKKSYRGIVGPDEGVVTNVNIKNNIVTGFNNYAIYFTSQRVGSTIDRLTVTNNMLYNNGTNDVGFNNITPTNFVKINNLTTDPLFVNMSEGDFHLQENSPAIGTGVYVTGLTTDLDGVTWKNPPSRGAYESVGVYNGPYYLAPNGSDTDGDGSINNPWFSLKKAWPYLDGGNTVYLRGGIYVWPKQSLSGCSGVNGNLIKVFNYPGEKPKITPTIPFDGGWWPYALIEIDNGDYLHFKGLEVTGVINTQAGDGTAFTMMGSKHSIIELLDYHDNGSGLGLINTDDCRILNCDVYRNADPNTSYDPYGNADGIAINGTDPNAINYIEGCRIWWNSDDGIDLWKYQGHIYIENCWAFWNGFIPGTWNKGGDGNGFKMGIQDVSEYTIVKQHYYNNLAFQNKKWGFIDNGAKVNIEIYNNTSYQNGYKGLDSWSGGYCMTTTAGGTKYYLKNNIAYANANTQVNLGDLTNIDHNTWDLPVTVTDADFLSVDVSGVTGPRKSDGSLPELNFLKLAQGSDLIDKGVNVGLPFNGSAPDLGAYESDYTVTKPNINTKTMTDVTINSAVTGGVVTSDGGSPITAKGVCWNTSPNPTIADSHTDEGPGGGEFTSNLTGLTPNTLYYVRAYATNEVGTSYGEEVSFTTLKELFLPEVITDPISAITTNSAISGGNVTFDGNTEVTTRGICWSTSPNPTIDDNIVYSGSGIGAFIANLSSLTPNTTYYVKAFATNSVGVAYGDEVVFTTLKQLELPVVITAAITNVTQTSAVSGGNVTFDGFDFVTTKGVVWSTSPGPTVDNEKTNDGDGTGAFTSSISPLNPNTKYYVKAYAENSIGVSYGEEKNFTTLSDVSSGIKIYPNPVPSSVSHFRVEVTIPNFDSVRVYIYNLSGKLIYTEKMNCWLVNWIEGHTRNEAIIPRRKFSAGMYIVQVRNKKGTIVIGKVIIL